MTDFVQQRVRVIPVGDCAERRRLLADFGFSSPLEDEIEMVVRFYGRGLPTDAVAESIRDSGLRPASPTEPSRGISGMVCAASTASARRLAEVLGRTVALRGLAAELASSVDASIRTPTPLHLGDSAFVWGSRTYVMGIVNATPDSFSGDGIGADVERGVRLAVEMVADGADIIDVGGESTRPGHAAVSIEEEVARVVPMVRAIASAVAVPISVDTSKADVAREGLAAGASVVNDVWGLQGDDRMAGVIAQAGASVVAMHNRKESGGELLMDEIVAFLRRSQEIALEHGIPSERVMVDPGFGFGKDWQENLAVLRRLGELRCLGSAILIGTSRKSTLGRVLDLPVEERAEATAATVALGISWGADIVRVHDVREMCRVARMSDALVRGR